MNTTTAYTPLESLLLFQSLAASGTDPDVFIRTSSLLKSNSLVKDNETYDPGRLSPDALRELYLQLLREDLRIEAQGDGREDLSLPKKRKLQSPPLPTIKDANEYSERLPQLVDRLYGRYRDHMIRSIRDDERKYESLQREIAEIERGEWDERIPKGDRGKLNRAVSVASEDSKPTKVVSGSSLSVNGGLEEITQENVGIEDSQQKDGQQPQMQPSPSPVPPQSPRTEPKHEGLGISDVLNNQEPSSPRPSEPQDSLPGVRNNSQDSPSPGHQLSASDDRQHGPSPLQPMQQLSAESWKWEQHHAGPVPQQPPPYQHNLNYPQFSAAQYPEYPPAPHRGSFSVPSGHGLLPPQGHLPSSPPNNTLPHPIVLPPPNIGRGPGSPGTRHLDQLADVAEQQYRAPSASSSITQGGVSGSPFGQPYPAYPPSCRSDGRPTSGNGTHPQWNQHYPPQYAPVPGYNYLPQPPPPSQHPPPTRSEIIQAEQRQYNSPYIPSQSPRLIAASSSMTPRPHPSRDPGILPHTPASYILPLNSTGKATRWIPTPTASTPKVPKSPIQPAYEPLSPILSPATIVKTPKTRRRDWKTEASSATKPRGKSQRRAQRTRAGSTASPVIPGSRRSQSVMSHADELSLVNDGIGGRTVKQESSTPRAVYDIADATADEGNTLRRRALKRKRQESPVREPSGPPTHVLWTRNFPKISASAIEHIGALRSASTFALPIKERDAPGYRHLILRPQDLKSIRTAINAGYKSGVAAASVMDDSGQASMMLPISEDLVPPKGIVNNAQLEKELMRMFANAVMFNHDPNRSLGKAFEAVPSVEGTGGAENYEVDENGVVNETRAMFADVEKIVGEMRNAERRSEEQTGEAEEDEVDELAGAGDIGTGSLVKRRRRA